MNNYTINISVSREKIVDLFISACEGGSNYWCAELTPKGKGDAYWAMLEGFEIIEIEDGKKRRVTPAMIQKAVKAFPVKEPRHFGNFLSDDADAETADAFLQLCVFGETIYG